jgi:hypothetical protein
MEGLDGSKTWFKGLLSTVQKDKLACFEAFWVSDVAEKFLF